MKILNTKNKFALVAMILLVTALTNLLAGNHKSCTSSPDGCSAAHAEDNPTGASCQYLENAPGGVKFCVTVPYDDNCEATNYVMVLTHTGTCQPTGGGGFTCTYSDQGEMLPISMCQ